MDKLDKALELLGDMNGSHPHWEGDEIFKGMDYIGEIDHGNVVFLVDSEHEDSVRMLLNGAFGEKDWEFIY